MTKKSVSHDKEKKPKKKQAKEKRKPKHALDELVAQITDENRHDEWDTGPAVGKEIFWLDDDSTA
jgi:antitoxin component of MazEF toxin-antitoxin module